MEHRKKTFVTLSGFRPLSGNEQEIKEIVALSCNFL